MALISFASLNKKTIILLFFISTSILACIIPAFFELIMPFEIDLIDYSSQVLIGLPFLLHYLFSKNKKNKIFSHFSKLDYIIFFIMIIIELIHSTIYVIFDDTLLFFCILFNKYNIDIILLEILSKYASNSGFFIHHFIGQIILFIPSIMVDIYKIYNNDEKNIHFNLKHFAIIFLDSITDNVLLTYKKYLIEIKFIAPFIVCFIFGLVNLIYILILFSFTLINRNVVCFKSKCFNIFDFDTSDYKNNAIICISIIFSIIIDCIFFFFYYHILDLFTTSHVIFIFHIFAMMSTIEIAKDNNLSLEGWLLISLASIFIFIGLFIYLEVIELNFCNLNKNIRNRIAERAKETETEKPYTEKGPEIELIEKKEEEDEYEEGKKEEKKIEIVPGYLIDI